MRLLTACLGSLLLGACANTPSLQTWDSAAGSAEAQIDLMMQPYRGDQPGAAVLVLKDGKPLLRRSYGMADLARATPVSPATNFRLASVSKQFTAAAILLLAEQGKLSLDDPVRKWFAGLPAVTAPITVRHLLSHSSGLIDYEDLMAQDFQGQLHDRDVLALLEKENRLYFTPGSDYRYSNGAYALLALLVGKASGTDFASFLKTRIFQPLGMDGTVAFEDGISSVPVRAYGYTAEPGHWVRTDQSSTSAVLGDGGIYSSINDLAKWDAALYDDRLLNQASRDAAFTIHTSIRTEADVEGYGYGWRIKGDMLWHSGETIGFRNVILRWPKQHFSVVVLTNRNAPEPYALARRIAALYQTEQQPD